MIHGRIVCIFSMFGQNDILNYSYLRKGNSNQNVTKWLKIGFTLTAGANSSKLEEQKYQRKETGEKGRYIPNFLLLVVLPDIGELPCKRYAETNPLDLG